MGNAGYGAEYLRLFSPVSQSVHELQTSLKYAPFPERK